MRRKAVFFDIDGTICDIKMRIPDSTREAIRRLRKNGHYAFLCSGRTKAFICSEHLLSIGFDGMVAGCGTYVEYQNQTLFQRKIQEDKVEEILHVLREDGLWPILEGEKALYLDTEDCPDLKYEARIRREMGNALLPITGQKEKWNISKFCGVCIDDRSHEKAICHLKDQFQAMIHGKHGIEFAPVGYNKATGIELLCEKLGIEQGDTYGFGDSVNDVDMLTYVGTGVAMGDGTMEAKSVADYITAPLMESGIYQALEHLKLI